MVKNDATSIVVIPSKVFANVNEFLNDGDIKPQFFKDYKFVVQPPYTGDNKLEGNKKAENCYKDAIRIVPSTLFALITFWAATIFSL